MSYTPTSIHRYRILITTTTLSLSAHPLLLANSLSLFRHLDSPPLLINSYAVVKNTFSSFAIFGRLYCSLSLKYLNLFIMKSSSFEIFKLYSSLVFLLLLFSPFPTVFPRFYFFMNKLLSFFPSCIDKSNCNSVFTMGPFPYYACSYY